MKALLLELALALALTPAPVLAAKCPVDITSSYPAPKVAEGWSARVVAKDLAHPRQIAIDSSGALLITDEEVGVVRLVFEDHGGTCLTVANRTLLVDDREIGHGLALSKDTLYASTSNNVYSWPYNGTIGERSTLVTNMSNDAGHSSRTLLLSRDEMSLFVSRGSAGNIDPLALDKASGHCQIRQFEVSSQDVNFPTAGRLVGWGLRNSVGVAQHPDGGIWSVENSVDNLMRRGVDIHQDNPAEELNFHGKVDDTNEGGNYGYPACFALWATDVPDIGNLTTGDQFAADPNATITGGNTTAPSDAQCNSEYEEPVLAFQAHTAPLDIKFDEGGNTAYVSFHGSWNRDDKVGYEVGALDFADGRPVAEHSSKTATRSILANADISQCPDKCFRPVGLAWDSQGRLWMSSDTTGEIYVLLKGTESWENSGGRIAPVTLGVVVGVIIALCM